MTPSELEPILYRGELVALASRDRAHIIAPWLAARPSGDPELRFVSYMCLCYQQLATGAIPGPFSSALAERWARRALIDGAALASEPTDQKLAERLRVPVEQIQAARDEQ